MGLGEASRALTLSVLCFGAFMCGWSLSSFSRTAPATVDHLLLNATPACTSTCTQPGRFPWLSTKPERTLTVFMFPHEFAQMDNWFFYFQDVIVEQIGLRVRIVTNLSNSSRPFPGATMFVASWRRLHQLRAVVPQLALSKYAVFIYDDEGGQILPSVFSPEVALILRPYYVRHSFQDERVVYVPTGYFFGRGPRLPSILLNASQRQIFCWFSGALTSPRRKNMVETVELASKGFGGCELTITPWFGQGMAAGAYSLQMQDVVFALVPGGKNPETIRLYEALENGAIPVMVHADVKAANLTGTHPGFPGIVLPDWSHIHQLGQFFQPGAHAALDELQRKNLVWYQNYKVFIGARLREHFQVKFPEIFL